MSPFEYSLLVICSLQKEELPPYLYSDVVDYDETVSLAIELQPAVFFTDKENKIDSLYISNNHQLFGVSFIKNEGDLDGDGGDELGYVVGFADWSFLNSYQVATYKNGKWHSLYSFSIREWQIGDGYFLAKTDGTKAKIMFVNEEAETEEKIVDLSKEKPSLIKSFGLERDD